MSEINEIHSEKKFSLVELLMIIMLVGIIFTIIVPLSIKTKNHQKITEAIYNLQLIAYHDVQFYNNPDNGYYAFDLSMLNIPEDLFRKTKGELIFNYTLNDTTLEATLKGRKFYELESLKVVKKELMKHIKPVPDDEVQSISSLSDPASVSLPVEEIKIDELQSISSLLDTTFFNLPEEKWKIDEFQALLETHLSGKENSEKVNSFLKELLNLTTSLAAELPSDKFDFEGATVIYSLPYGPFSLGDDKISQSAFDSVWLP
ncbi:MAG: hypothetical protein K9N06_08730 [Candidatus Cloacimonetes bacterium]|nr:hypothetical protein [Candidatus Cloacimonadota bacterium]